jgi:hypothetical protein
MENEFQKMQRLAGVPVTKTKKQLDENEQKYKVIFINGVDEEDTRTIEVTANDKEDAHRKADRILHSNEYESENGLFSYGKVMISIIKESLNENFVGLGMVGNIFDRPKTDYELAYEHYLGKLNEGDDEEIPSNPEDYTKQPGYVHEEDTTYSDTTKYAWEVYDFLREMFPEVGEDERMIKILESAIRIIKSSNLNEEVGADGEENPIDSITMDVPLFIRMLEFAREDASTDMDLHDVAEKATAMSAEGEILSMDNYESIVGGEAEELDEVGHFKYTSKRGYGDKKVGTYLGKYPIYQDDEGNNYIKTGSGIKDVEDLDQSKVKINN